MAIRTKYIVSVVFALAAVLLFAVQVYGSVTFTTVATPEGTYRNFSFFNGATTTGTNAIQQATSTNTTDGGGYFVIAGAKKVEFYFSHGGTATTSTATSTFTIQVTPGDGLWYDYTKLLTSTSTALTKSVSVEGATSTVRAVMNDYLLDTFYAVRCIANGGGAVGTQGEHTCRASAVF